MPDGQSSIAGTHIVEEKNQSCPLALVACLLIDKYTYVYIQMYCFKRGW